MTFSWLVFSVFFTSLNAAEIDMLECEPPDQPVWGSYGPRQTYYMPGDVVHYFCDVDTYIGGIFYRKCEDTGAWSGKTPVCDAPSEFKGRVYQTSDFDEDSSAQAAIDGLRSTCTETIGGEREEWWGNFTKGGQVIRVRLFLPKGRQNLEIVLTRNNGNEVVCGRISKNIDRFDWYIQNCPETNNHGATGLKIRSLTKDPLRICELQANVLTSPKCTDPLHRIENGRLLITRKTATLVCDKGYTRSPNANLECVRDGEWNRKTLYCLGSVIKWITENPWTTNEVYPGPFSRRRLNPQRERQGTA